MSMSSVPHLLLEVCIDSVESAIAAIRGGANRLELCGNLGLGGGTTPSMGLFRAVKRVAQNIPIMVMIRPRAGDFTYAALEMDTMLEDIHVFKQAGANGFVFGVLTPEGRVDVDRTFILTAQATPLEVCFHRAFDMTRDPMEALRDLKSIPGVTRILTSGQGKKAPASTAVLRKLVHEAKRTVEILPGSGINKDTVSIILESLIPYGLREVHMSGGAWMQSKMTFRREDMGMGLGGDEEWAIWRTSEDEVREVRRILDEHDRAQNEKKATLSEG